MTHTNGPVPLQSADYITRKFELETLGYLYTREWILILGPRQHGKTSALLRIRKKLKDDGLLCAFVDLQALPPSPTFPDLLEWFAKRIAATIGTVITDVPKGKGDSLEDWLASAIPIPSPPVVIIIDEASAIEDDAIRNAFFGQIRALKSAAEYAEDGSVCSIVQFIFSGTFRPETLVAERNSPFNVCRRVETEDFDLENITALSQTVLSRAEVGEIPALIYSAVGGQPHLVQHLLTVVMAQLGDNEGNSVAVECERLRQHGSDHIDSVFSVVVADSGLRKIASAAATGGQVLNDPANVDYKFLQVNGLMRRDGDKLIFRNDLYKKIAEASLQLRPESAGSNEIATHFFPLEISSFAFITDPEFREICHSAYSAAVSSINSGSYRITLVSFGVALEAMLMDFLAAQSGAAIAAAIAACKGKERPDFQLPHEKATDPMTWRLVNHMKVARQLRGANGPIEIPDALRDMRNFVHPGAMKRAYQPEIELRPEAIAAGGLFGIAMRDIQ
ncbi:hypothetical protein GQ37_022635 [Janthinobacterium sp. BJB1]|nr:hypothetical protein GQ37_022635 [Janthinobacterium sp. BJB1]